jgi:predicted nucleotidyltransferase
MTSHAYKKYADAWEKRAKAETRRAEVRRREALSEARRAARILADEFGVDRVVVFGSVLRPGAFREGSDIDLAVEGLAPGRFFEACGRLMVELEFEIDLKPVEDLRGLIRERVKEGEVVYEKTR